MKYIYNDITDPCFNLALEEYIMTNCDISDKYFILWQNRPSIIIGKYQNTIEEINSDFVSDNHINVVRRLSGGGAVYHDLGNLNFTFITGKDGEKDFDFRKFTYPVLKLLESLGVKAEFNSRNDLTIDGKKFSGNSQYIKNKKLLHHGTLLFNSNLEDVVKALNVSGDKIESKGIKSIRSRVTNISEYLKSSITIGEFKDLLADYVMNQYEGSIKHNLEDWELQNINKLADDKYRTWEWNYGSSPEFNYKNAKKFDGGKIEVILNIKKGKIEFCKFYGDFFCNGELGDIERKLIGIKYNNDEVDAVFRENEINKLLLGISSDQLINCMFDNRSEA